MGGIVENIFNSITNKSADETLSFSMMTSAAGASVAYLGATLEATTPEVRRLFSEYTTQNVMAHEAMTALSIKKSWITPYEAPINQLGAFYKQSQNVLEHRQ